MNPKKLYDETISREKTSLAPSFNSIKSGIYRQINKNIPTEPENIEDIPNDFIGFQTNDNKKFLIYRDSNLMIFQSDNKAKILNTYPNDLFTGAIFKICPKPFSQLLILRVNDYYHNAFHTVCFILMKNKTKFLYTKGIVMMKCNYKKLFKNELKISVIHCDFEEGLTNALINCFPECETKHCFFHYGQILFRKINSTGANGLNINIKFEESRSVQKLFYMIK